VSALELCFMFGAAEYAADHAPQGLLH